MNGASTNPNAHVVAYAGAQVKKGLEIAKKLGAENFGKLSLNLHGRYDIHHFTSKHVAYIMLTICPL